MAKDFTQALEELLANPEKIMDPAKHPHLLANQATTAIDEYLQKDQRIILPIGSTEQHGPDACLGVDHQTSTGIAYAVSKLTGILCAPPLNYGMAVHHLDFAGTVALRPTTYINVVIDILYSLKRHGFKEIYVVNGHGGNKGPFLNAMQERIDEFADLEIRFINWWVMPGLQKNVIDKYFGEKEGYHATPTEVAVTMALIPDAIKLPETYTCPQQEVVGANATWVMPKKFRKLYPDGVMRADYSLATKEIGIEALRYSIKEIIEEFDLI